MGRIALAALCALATASAGEAAVRYVATTGSDSGGTNNCATSGSPCASIQRAIDASSTPDEIRVAGGTYVYSGGGSDVCTVNITTTAIACVLNKVLTLRGGYSTANWTSPDAGANPTILDGQTTRRGVLVQDTEPGSGPSAGLTFENFVVRNGLSQVPTGGGGDNARFGFGGGFQGDNGVMVIRNSTFEDNLAKGKDNPAGATYGGAAGGGGVALRGCGAGTTLDNVRFTGNIARGGTGSERGGFAIGGGLYTFKTNLTATDLTFENNLSEGGDSTGDGETAEGFRADGQGGGIAFQLGSTATVTGLTVAGSTTRGGNAKTSAGGYAGGAYGGGVVLEGAAGSGEATNVTLRDAVVTGSLAEGGNAFNGGLARGGGIMTGNASITLDRVLVVDNQSLGGDAQSAGVHGAADGGGGTFSRVTSSVSISTTIKNAIVAGNFVDEGSGGTTIVGGGGGGFFFQGHTANLDHVTIAGNRIGSAMQGQGVVAISGFFGAGDATTVDLDFAIVADHTVPAGAKAVHAQSGQTIRLDDGLFAGNNDDSNQGEGGSGTIQINDMMSAGSADFLSPDAPDFDYRLLETSPAIDNATGSSETLDFEQQARDGSPDVGADEYAAVDGIFSDDFESGCTVLWDDTQPSAPTCP